MVELAQDFDNQDNVLKYIYMLNEHMDKLKLLLQGLSVSGKTYERINDPVAPDVFILTQISSLSVILTPFNFVSQIKSTEKEDIIMDTYTAFIRSILDEPFFDWKFFHMTTEAYYNTLHLFLNILEGGFGAQFTLGVQTGVTSKIHKTKENTTVTPFVDLPQLFGHKPTTPPQPREAIPNNNYYDEEDEQ